MVIDNFKLSDVTVLLHDSEESKENFRRRSDDNLLLSFSFSINNGLETVSEDVGSSHY